MIAKIYEGNYKLLLLLPLALILISLYYIPQIKLGVDFKGGTLITLVSEKELDVPLLKTELGTSGIEADVQSYQTTVGYKTEIEIEQSEELINADQLKSDFNSKIGLVEELEANSSNDTSGLPLYVEKRKEVDAIANQLFTLAKVEKNAETISNLNQLRKEVEDAHTKVYSNYRDFIANIIESHADYESISVQAVSPTLQKRFIEKAGFVALYAGILITVLVFVFLRKIVPSFAVVIGAVWDIIIALGAMGLFGIPFSLPSFAALLMIVGFSLDTHILLTRKMLDASIGTPKQRVVEALGTGTTMSITGMSSFVVLLLVAQLMRITTYYDISAVALAGFIGDLVATWTINAVLMLWYVEK